jgi:hypothetical protein
MGINIRVKKPTNHALILSVMLRSFGLEKLDTLFAQGQSNFDTLLAKSQLGRGWKKVCNHLRLAKGFIHVLYFRAHKLSFLCANDSDNGGTIGESHRKDATVNLLEAIERAARLFAQLRSNAGLAVLRYGDLNIAACGSRIDGRSDTLDCSTDTRPTCC